MHLYIRTGREGWNSNIFRIGLRFFLSLVHPHRAAYMPPEYIDLLMSQQSLDLLDRHAFVDRRGCHRPPEFVRMYMMDLLNA